MKESLVTFGSGLVVGLVLALAVGWYFQKDPPVAEQATEILTPPTETIAVTEIKVHKHKKKKKVYLPKKIQEDESLHLTAAARVAPDDHTHTVSALFDSNLKTIKLFDAREPLPWLAFGGEKFVSAYYGLKDQDQGDPETVGRFGFGMDLVRIKALKFGGSIQVDTDGDYFLAVGGRVTWR